MHRLLVHEGGRERPSKTNLLDVLLHSDEVTLIGITHHELPDALNRALEVRSKFWSKIQIVYPNVNNMHRLIDDGIMPNNRLDEWEASRVTVQMILEGKRAQYASQWSCVDCMQPLSFIGSRAVVGRKSNIRFTPLLSGLDPRNLIPINISTNTGLFAQISQAFDLVVSNCAAIVEWDLIGVNHVDQSVFRYYGIIPRVSISALVTPRNAVFPITVILPYVKSLDGSYVVLQERTALNATNAIGKISTISTRVCTADVVNLHPGRFWMNLDANPRPATDTFNALSGLFEGAVLDKIVWRRAASRSLREELGLDIALNRLTEWRQVTHDSNGSKLYFQVFALELRQDLLVDELGLIMQRRPNAAMRKYRLTELQRLYENDRLNHLLQTQFETVFLPLFQQIQVIS